MNSQLAAREPDTAALAAETLAAFGRLRLRLAGTSMLPALRPGDEVEFHALVASGAKAGDVVLFRRGGGLVAHRVLAATDEGLVTQGDSLDAPDPMVAYTDVLGLGVALTRNGRAIAWGNSQGSRSRLARWCLRRYDMASRLWLYWHRFTARRAA
jgi:hypothetical protein